jgi:hypothetical protein
MARIIVSIVLFMNISILCDAQFTEQWNHIYNNQASGQESAYKMISDENGKIFTVGHKYSKLFVSKHDNNGSLIWRKTDLHQDLYLRGFDRDSTGNLYIFGTRILKCDSLGNMIDSTDFSFIPNFSQLTSVVKGKYAFYLTASTLAGSDYRVQVFKMDFNLNVIWQMNYNSSFDDWPSQILIDVNENIFVIGSNSGNNQDILILKYDSTGIFKFQKTYNNVNFNQLDISRDALIDREGNLVISGETYESPGNYEGMGVVLKYDSLGNLLWQEFYDDPNANCAISSIGNYILEDSLFYYSIRVNSCSGINLSKLTFNGDSLWSISRDIGNNIVSDALFDFKHNLVVNAVGESSKDIVVLSFDTTGNFLWQKSISGTLLNFHEDRPADLMLNPADSSIITCGYVRNLVTSTDAIIASFKDSVLIWKDEYDDIGNLSDIYHQVALNSSNEIIGLGVSTYRYYPEILDSAFLVKLDLNGNVLWKNIIEMNYFYSAELIIDNNDDYIIYSLWQGIYKFSKTGNLLWYVPIENVNAISYDGLNSIYFAGMHDTTGVNVITNGVIDTLGNITYFNSIAYNSQFEAGCVKILRNSNNLYYCGGYIDYDYYLYKGFILKTDLFGNVFWSDTISTYYSDILPNDMIFDAFGNICIAGTYFEPINDTNAVYLIKYNPLGQRIAYDFVPSVGSQNSVQLILNLSGGYYLADYKDFYGDIITIKSISNLGIELWTIDLDLSNYPTDPFKLYIDNFNNLIITLGSSGIFTFNPNGFLISNYNLEMLGGEVLFTDSSFISCGITNYQNYQEGDGIIKYVDFEAVNTVSLIENEIENVIKIFPNPSNSKFQINMNKFDTGTVSIFNLDGKLVHSEALIKQNQVFDFKLKTGVYNIVFSSDHQFFSDKLVIVD